MTTSALQIRTAIESVTKLLRLAAMDCGGSKPAAAVLLSAYDSSRYPLEVDELCRLDPEHTQAALNVIALRVCHSTEPHQVIKDGSKVFEDLIADWGEVLRVENRATATSW